MKKVLSLVCMAVLANAYGEDWSAWRGPSKNGVSAESRWKPVGAKVKWTKELGAGYSTVSVKDGKLYTAGHEPTGSDTIYCLNADTGEEIWKYKSEASTGSFKGPRATPVIDGDFLYMLNRDGVAYCLNLADGSLKWKTELLKEEGKENNQWGIASSAVIYGDLVLLNVGVNGTALNKATGKVVWTSKGKQGYASAVLMERAGKTEALFFSAETLQAVDAKTGEKKAEYAWKTSWDVNGADPLVIGDKIFITSGYNHGGTLLDYSSAKLEKVWENQLICSQFSSCVEIDGYIYGIDGQTKKKGCLRCISAKDGSEKWNERIGFGSLMAADGKLIVLDERGTLYFAKAAPESYEEIAQFDTGLGQLCWTSPVLANGTIYCRNDKGTLVAVDVSQ